MNNNIITAKTTAKRLDWIDGCRAIAIFFIVGFHVLFLVTGRLTGWCYLLGTVTDSGTVIFVLLAGSLLQYNFRKFNYFSLLQKKIVSVIAPYVIASTGILILHHIKDHDVITIKSFCWDILLGTASVPFWFIPMIMVFFLLSPILFWIDKKKLYYYLIPLLILPFWVGRGHHYELFHNMLFFFPFFLAGMVLSAYWEMVNRWFNGHKWLIIVLPLVPMMAAFMYNCEPAQTLAKVSITLWVVMIFGCYGGSSNKVVGLVANNSMAIYLYHNSIIGLLSSFVIKLPNMPVVFTLLLWVGVTSVVVIGLILFFETAHWVLAKFGIKNSRWLFGR